MNNNQNSNNNTPTNINTIPVMPPVAPQGVQTQPVENAQNVVPTPNVAEPAAPSNNSTNHILPSADDIRNMQSENANAINALNIGDSNQNQVSLENQNYNETSINDLNVDGQYNRMEKIPDYVNSPEVQENIHPTKKNTVTITKEMKTILIMVGIMLAFIIIMPFLFDLFSKIRFH